ncbi:hypothetical protein M407DRAFT_241552 [Tulasnella calospora MUT 4182]|uniref:Uncharacterized protein n=1 Tax=Tulasnella calospora MUT 4182 TaxID=1051891 RepID=A0A0C3QIW6_9AGAM|nr:hypothetical protein M407DRAFT_241552 [Tulasnella calospora MUT 4182]
MVFRHRKVQPSSPHLRTPMYHPDFRSPHSNVVRPLHDGSNLVKDRRGKQSGQDTGSSKLPPCPRSTPSAPSTCVAGTRPSR